jgi:hypothetical protein
MVGRSRGEGGATATPTVSVPSRSAADRRPRPPSSARPPQLSTDANLWFLYLHEADAASYLGLRDAQRLVAPFDEYPALLTRLLEGLVQDPRRRLGVLSMVPGERAGGGGGDRGAGDRRRRVPTPGHRRARPPTRPTSLPPGPRWAQVFAPVSTFWRPSITAWSSTSP